MGRALTRTDVVYLDVSACCFVKSCSNPVKPFLELSIEHLGKNVSSTTPVKLFSFMIILLHMLRWRKLRGNTQLGTLAGRSVIF